MNRYRILKQGKKFYPMIQTGVIFKKWSRIYEVDAENFYLFSHLAYGHDTYEGAKGVIDRYHKNKTDKAKQIHIVGDFTI